MKLLDRLLIRSYLKAYIICLVSLLSLYIVMDLFMHIEEFTEKSKLLDVLKLIGAYYGFQVSQIFDRLCEAIVLLAAMFTVAWMQRNNELMPLLSAGVATRRVVRPILLCASGLLFLSVANKELIIPRVGMYLSNDRNDPRGEKEMMGQGTIDSNNVYVEGRMAARKGLMVRDFFVLIPETIAGELVTLHAAEARYVPPGTERRSGGWLLTGTKPAEIDKLETWNQRVLELIDSGKYFLQTRDADFDAITRNRNWFNFASTTRLREELNKPESTRLAPMAVLFHMRMTRPILGMILVILGLSIILRDQNRNVFISSGMCLMLCAIFFAVQFGCKFLGDNCYLPAALAAWLPVLFFGPLSLATFDAIHT